MDEIGLTLDELNVLEILYWLAMYPDDNCGRSISIRELYIKKAFDKRMDKINPKIEEFIRGGNVPKRPYASKGMSWDSTSNKNPLRSVLNHLYRDNYIELDERKMNTDVLNVLKNEGEFNFSNSNIDNHQPDIFIVIRRKGIVVAESEVERKRDQNQREETLQEQKRQNESSDRLNDLVTKLGITGVLVAMGEWDTPYSDYLKALAFLCVLFIFISHFLKK